MLSVAVAQLVLLLLRPDGVAADGTNSSNMTTDPRMPDTFKTVTIKEQSLEKKIEVLEAAYHDLSCTVGDAFDGKPDSIKGYWTKDGKEINQTQVTIQRKMDQYHLQKRFHIDGNSLGKYSCVFINGTKNVTKSFLISAPSMKEKTDKPIVRYIGDSTVLTCNIHPPPLAWEWYKVNRTEKVSMDYAAESNFRSDLKGQMVSDAIAIVVIVNGMINVTDSPPRYKTQVFGNESRLTMVNLVEEDTGTYICFAIYPIGPVRGEVILRVISFMEPLKPFLVVLVEVVLLVFLILLCECQGRRKGTTAVPENGTHIDQTEKLRKEEPNGIEETTARRRMV